MSHADATLPAMLFDELTEVLDPEPHDAALNMALDEVLLASCSGPLLRVYRWLRPAVSFGYFGKVDDVEAAWPDREIVRRWTGGGIVPHGADVTYTLAVPRSCAFARRAPEETYRAIHERLAGFLTAWDDDVRVTDAAHPPVSGACFENAVRYDIIAARGKVAGAAQRRTRTGLLHQGSIQGMPRPAEVAALLGKTFATNLIRRPLSPDELAAGVSLAAARYATEAWLRRM